MSVNFENINNVTYLVEQKEDVKKSIALLVPFEEEVDEKVKEFFNFKLQEDSDTFLMIEYIIDHLSNTDIDYDCTLHLPSDNGFNYSLKVWESKEKKLEYLEFIDFSDIYQSVEMLANAYNEMVDELETVTHDRDHYEAQLDDANDRVSNLESDNEELEGDISSLEDKISELEQSIKDSEENESDLEYQISELEKKVAELEDIITEQEEQIIALEEE